MSTSVSASSGSGSEVYSSTDMSGSVGDGSEGSPGTVGIGSDSFSGMTSASTDSASKEGTSSSSSGTSGSPTSTTKTPTSTTKTPTSTTKTPTSTTKTPTSTTKTPSSTPSTDTSSSDSATTIPSTSTLIGSNDGTRRLMGEAGEADTTTTTGSSSASGTTGITATTTPRTTTTATTTPSTTTWTPSTTTTTTGSSSTSGTVGTVGSTSGSTTAVEFSCDSTFYGAWTQMGLTCEGTELDVTAAASSSQCRIYSGTSSGTDISNLATCMSVCSFPACNNGTWDYSADDGISSEVYANLDFITFMGYAGTLAAEAVAGTIQQPFSNLTFTTATECEYESDDSFGTCNCAGIQGATSSSSTAGTTASSSNSAYTVPVNKGLEDTNHWPDGTSKTTVDKAGIASTTIGGSAATVSVVAGGVMSVASGVVGGTSASVASGVSAAASVGITMAAVDLCQFSVMLNQMNVDARPRFLENMGKKMSPAAFTFLPFGKTNTSDDDSTTSATRRLGSTSGSSGSGSSSTTTGVQGMEKYATLIGVQPDKLFYLAVAGIACVVALLFGLYALAMGAAYFFVEDFPTFSRKWLDKAIGVLMMVLILSEYVVGATAMYQICYCIDHDSVDVSFFLAIVSLLVLAFGTILYGVLVIKNNEDELRDLGTKDHFDKKFHNRYGPLYDEHSFEGRFFFAPKLLLALLCGMTTGMVWIQGLWQIIVLIALHIVFLLYLEIKQPYPTAFVQKTSSFVIIIKISALFLSFFLLSSATSFTESIPDDLREGVGFAIVGLQVLVLVCLMIRQVYIFYRTWKLKRDGVSDDDGKTVTVQTTNAREGSEAFFALGGEPQYYGNQSRGNSLAVLGDSTPKMNDPRQYAQETPSNANDNYNYNGRLRGLQQPAGGHGMQRTHTVVQHEGHRNNEVDL
ncbi:hypothetical protein BBO99_00009537 [Phytophthora kernoviae]|uniref:TRP C-terminal domain-containing protein n=2 Tax=Phytophthora kernoviae TaxID=325452 RepID=A0A3R7K4H0_9STRA|nr:hypothetical protein G195_011114 [Phytophthora kernoviae 00238/432]KAG2503548.1 hypothetical protein JM16_009446 [Phytophthora kernoviae]KAG2505796.1 hypothetical protein JM18_009457 [Phytophthora kernoviae]RLN14600.1 hypothetical protein BBI17_009589 [Phytophthora kernoviae]RLN73200.1 hypothetical protein BBO99_00009537 [Phytophthora kernoviae]